LTEFNFHDKLSGTAGGVMLVPSRRASRRRRLALSVARRSLGIQPSERLPLEPSACRLNLHIIQRPLNGGSMVKK